jgi:NAD(P)-dependent dehydrogenase (short-subunit alcohol dehydrogenase family)
VTGPRLDGKVALVTGGASGIGRAAALAMAGEGARVMVADVAAEGGDETVRLVKAAGGDARFTRADMTRAADIRDLVAATVSAYGRLDCAFNNAGVPGAEALTADYPDDAWDHVLAVNLTAVWRCMREEIRQMLPQGGGAIVNTASVAGLRGLRRASAYVAAKHGVVGLTKTAALEYARAGLRINAVCPGFIETGMTRSFLDRPGVLNRVSHVEPVGRIGQPQEIAEAVVWLCSDAASFVTGLALPVDGGLTAR